MAWLLFSSLRGLRPSDLTRELAAGVTLAAIAIPEQMATARLGGFDAQLGLFAFLAGSLAFAAFGASRILSVGADSTITPIFAATLMPMAATSADRAGLAGVLALLVGAVLLIGGTLRLGWIADLLSKPVVTGFLAGIAVHIFLSQAPVVLGVPGGGDTAWQRVAALIAQRGEINPIAIALGLWVFAITFGCERLSPRIPGALVALASAIVAVFVFDLDHRGVKVLGDVGGALPHFALPSAADLQGLYQLVPLSILI